MNLSRLLSIGVPSLAIAVLVAAGLPSAPAVASAQDTAGPADPLQAELERAFESQGLHLDLKAGLCSIPAKVCIRDDLLEYLLVADYGASHESLFSTAVTPSIWNTALVALGAERARGARYSEKDPLPTDEQIAAGVPPFQVELPTGTPFYVYALWREGEEAHLHRLEDLIGNLRTGRAMRRHALRYVGSRMVRPDPEKEEELFSADMEGNLINVFFFQNDKTIVSTAVEDAVYDTIWVANSWLVPERGTEVQLIVSREVLDGVPASVKGLLGE